VVASGAGLVIANNMMYSHTSTVYDSRTHELVETLDDGLDLTEFGLDGHPGTSQGAPVEAAWTADGRYAYVSQYTMYGEGFGRTGFDDCSPASGVGASLLYRFDAQDLAWDQVIEVGAVPKYVDITPDQTRVLVSNWCDSTISVVDRESATVVAVIPVDAAPRGIEVLPDNRTAYVAAMYADKLFKVDLQEGTSEVAMETARKPRHLILSEDGRYLFMAVSGADTIYKIDTRTDEIVDEVVSGREPRSMAMSSDGTALYVVNYYEPSVAKISTQDMEVLQKEPTDANPIGVTYDPVTHEVWVACYGGSLYVFDDQAQ
jgi:YVTN family beta-propeller protein